MRIVIRGQTISKKNSKQIVTTPSGKRRIISSEAYQAWEQYALWQLKVYGRPTWRYPVRVRMTFYRQHRHTFDYNNLGQGPLDCLVTAGILADDDMNHVIPEYGLWQVDKVDPRVEIEIIEGDR